MTLRKATLTTLMSTFFSLLLLSCGGSSDSEVADREVADSTSLDFSDMSAISLEKDDLNLQIMLPEVASATGNSIDPLIEHEEGDYLWYISIGQRFKLIIEDFGKEMNKVEQEKERLADLKDIFMIEYIVDEANLIMYKRDLHEGQGGKPSYHCYGEVVIDGYNYVLRSADEGSLKPIIEDMVKTIRSASSTTTAS